MQNTSSLVIKQIKKIQDDELDAFNALLDEGMAWDFEQGAHFLSNDDNALFVAYWDKVPVGFLTAYRLQRFDQRKAEVLLYEIGVAGEHQRKGVGRALIDEVKKWAAREEADVVWVLTNKSNMAAMSLYKSTGGVIESDDEQMLVYNI